MTSIRVARRPKFTQIHRDTVKDPAISYRALGVLTWLLDKPDDWKSNTDQIAAARPAGEGRDAVRTALKELETAGYLKLERWRDAGGQFQSEWTVYERPNGTEPDRISRTGDPSGLPASDSQGLNTETVTEDCSSDSLRSRAKSDCIRCHGDGEFYNGAAGFMRRCPCTEERSLSAVPS